MKRTEGYYSLSALPLDERGAIPPEVREEMVTTGQAKRMALESLGLIVRCMDHNHTGDDGIALIDNNGFIKIGAACIESTPAASVIIPAQPTHYEQTIPQHTP